MEISGYNITNWAVLPKSKNTFSIGDEMVAIILDKLTPVPTFISVCPFCETDNKWRTTGALPGFIECQNCHQKFQQ